MSFDSHSLERLRELGRKLPKSLPTPSTNSKSNQKTAPKLHPIETEQDPQKLFRELINASPDGEIPSHLISRLKEAESLELQKEINNNKNPRSSTPSMSNPHYQKFKSKSIEEKDDLYVPFKQLLLEEEDNNNDSIL